MKSMPGRLRFGFFVVMAFCLPTCAHGRGEPDAPGVTVMRSGRIYPPLPDDCPLVFLNGQHMDILATGYEMLGFIMFGGSPAEIDRAASAIPSAVGIGACKMGGDAVSLAQHIETGRTTAIQFAIWRTPEGVKKAAKPAGEAEGAGQRI